MELEQVFLLSVEQKKVELPNLKLAVLVELLSLICPGIQFQLQTHLFLHKCPKLISTTSSTTLTTLDELKQLAEQAKRKYAWTSHSISRDIIDELEVSRTQDSTGDKNSIVEMVEEALVVGAESGCGLSSSLVNSNDGGDGQVATSSSPVITSSERVATEDAIGDRDSHQISPECEMDGFPKAPIAKSRHHELSSSLVNSNSIEKAPGLDIPLHKANSNEDVGAGHSHVEEQFSNNDEIRVTESKPIPSVHASESHSVPFEESNKLSPTIPSLIASQPPISFEEREDIMIEKSKSKDKSNEIENAVIEPTEEVQVASGHESEIRSILPTTLQKEQDNKRNIEEVATENVEIITSSTHSKSVSPEHKTYPQEDGDGQIAAEKPTTKDVDVSHSQETSTFAVSLAETHATGKKTTQIVEDVSFASLVTRELEQLVSTKYLASDNLSLLTDFLIRHPSVRLIDNSLSNRYKGYAYNCLAELLKFLQTHNVLDALGSNHPDFMELLQDVRKCSFEKEWLDDVERRALYPGLEVSQDALQKVSESKRQAIKEVEGLRLKVGILTKRVEDLKHQLASSEAVLDSIIQQETQVLEARAALRAPIGY